MPHRRRLRTLGAAGLVMATLTLCSLTRSVPLNDVDIGDRNHNNIPDECEKPSHRFGLKRWPVLPNGRLVPKGRAPGNGEDRLLFCAINDSSYWVLFITRRDFAPRSARSRFVLYDLTHTQLDTMYTNIMSVNTIQSARIFRHRGPVILEASVDGDTVYAYLRH